MMYIWMSFVAVYKYCLFRSWVPHRYHTGTVGHHGLHIHSQTQSEGKMPVFTLCMYRHNSAFYYMGKKQNIWDIIIIVYFRREISCRGGQRESNNLLKFNLRYFMKKKIREEKIKRSRREEKCKNKYYSIVYGFRIV